MLELRGYRSLLPLPRELIILCSIINIELEHFAEPSLDSLLYWWFLFRIKAKTIQPDNQEMDNIWMERSR